MQKVEDLVEQYAALELKKKPKLAWKIVPSTLEKIEIECEGGVLTVVANGERNLRFALKQAMIGLQSGHIREFIGVSRPLFPIRAIKIETEPLCLASYGFNTMTVWESGLLKPDFPDSEMTLAEKVYEEIRAAEGEELFAYIPAQNFAGAKKQIQWLPQLLDRVGERTTLAFAAMIEKELHPLWGALRKMETSCTPLLPIIDLALFPKIWPRLARHPFAGVIGTTCSERDLWIAGQALWHGRSPELSAETWELSFNCGNTILSSR